MDAIVRRFADRAVQLAGNGVAPRHRARASAASRNQNNRCCACEVCPIILVERLIRISVSLGESINGLARHGFRREGVERVTPWASRPRHDGRGEHPLIQRDWSTAPHHPRDLFGTVRALGIDGALVSRW